MDNTLAKLLGNDMLPPELVTSLQEAFDKKIAEARVEIEESVREELARRYEHDKDQLVEAMDRMITDTVQQYEIEKRREIGKLQEAQTQFQSGLKEARKAFRTRTKEHVERANKFVAEHLAAEVKTLREERSKLAETRVTTAKQIASLKENLAKVHNAHVKKIDEFVVKQLTRELNEFDQDRRALVETRVKLAAESRTRLKETQRRFVNESATKLDKMITQQLVSEMSEIHDDLERQRQNNFGRKIFEAMAAEFMTSYFAEGTEAKKLQNVLETKDTELASVKQRLAEAERSSQAAVRKARIAEDRAERSKIMSELLSNIRGEKRSIMEGMLDGVNTPDLRKTFDRLLPVVLNEGARKPAPSKQPGKVLSETRSEQPRVVTGDQRNNRLIEAVETENKLDSDAAQILRLAGIQK